MRQIQNFKYIQYNICHIHRGINACFSLITEPEIESQLFVVHLGILGDIGKEGYCSETVLRMTAFSVADFGIMGEAAIE